MLKKLVLAAIAAAATFMPVAAEVQPGTESLLRTVEEGGILVTYNVDACDTDNAHGSYRWAGLRREIRLCPGQTVDAIDHETVRHEVHHALQHCVNAARGTSMDTPIITDPNEFKEFVIANLSQQEINRVLRIYPRDQWPTELEAFASANAYTASQLEVFFRQVCMAS